MWCVPAIDVLEGRGVRLLQGDYGRVTVYDEDPVARVRAFVEAGARRVHVVDLDAARGRGDNRGVIARMVRAAGEGVVVEVGGGVRTERDVEELLSVGAGALVVGTVLVRDPGRVERWVQQYGRVFWAGIDARDGVVRVQGWEEEGGVEDVALAGRARDLGLCGVIYTNIARDGMLSGPDVEGARRVGEAAGLPVVVSGGVGGVEDVRRVAAEGGRWVCGVILGKAVYEGRVDLPALFREFPQGGLVRLEGRMM
ncbi:1-(5-phosphoribosyl)-5-((5- phosphoribosylamino)methylideneamino) imidazole-4-carboxamide isomerase [Spirochaeta thermophila DSM 6578]|uniref:1-(5-phosphoribosyl)-5-[(5-phosphoribosylamino)methylideneamino] imidazole-4-carboxamide isomerase n=1 Tax=Winmispira thermophila (strain ATCC 700085 / DSM 6578 / Z-1203) TaxID=869211 RepID=G0GC41_WINT7|nr:HisA/HisF-related TIM barrel protein [Spirochaeta thermophila]AEJ60405.1 1-(5-phosphoribosyl)-5-((5- phosphoribosylamino)methylideneamino) imidazole-4-carboxamide isomerase [Spirochaeta thermophila DSM 6578]